MAFRAAWRGRYFTASAARVVDPWTEDYGRLWMLRLAAGSFVVGAAMEAFMVSTGFYKIVTAYEAREREEKRVEWEDYVARQREVQAQVAREGAREVEASVRAETTSRWFWPSRSRGVDT